MPAVETLTNNTTVEVLVPGPQGAAATAEVVTQQEAEDGVINTGRMTPLRTAQAIEARRIPLSLLMALR